MINICNHSRWPLLPRGSQNFRSKTKHLYASWKLLRSLMRNGGVGAETQTRPWIVSLRAFSARHHGFLEMGIRVTEGTMASTSRQAHVPSFHLTVYWVKSLVCTLSTQLVQNYINLLTHFWMESPGHTEHFVLQAPLPLKPTYTSTLGPQNGMIKRRPGCQGSELGSYRKWHTQYNYFIIYLGPM